MIYEAIISKKELARFSVEILNESPDRGFFDGLIYQGNHPWIDSDAFGALEADYISDPNPDCEGWGWTGYIPREGDLFSWASETGWLHARIDEEERVNLKCEPSGGRRFCPYMEAIGLHIWTPYVIDLVEVEHNYCITGVVGRFNRWQVEVVITDKACFANFIDETGETGETAIAVGDDYDYAIRPFVEWACGIIGHDINDFPWS